MEKKYTVDEFIDACNKVSKLKRSSLVTIVNILKYGKKTCEICGVPITFGGITIDHIIPSSKGGVDHISNWQLAHEACNQEKGNRLLEEGELL